MQNAGLAALGLDWRYLAFEVIPPSLYWAIEGARVMGFVGLNLTLPHKLVAMELLDVFDESARIWGAANTIRFEARDRRRRWRPVAEWTEPVAGVVRAKGFNTDADGLQQSLREDLGLKLLRGLGVLILGAGGASRVAALKLAAEGASPIYLVNRTVAKSEALAAEMRRRFRRVKVVVGYPTGEVDLLVNATSAGLKANDPLPLDETKFAFRQARAVYDMIYRPAETPLLEAAKAAGCQTANGLGMLLHQGAKALEIWTGRPAPVKVMRAALEKAIYV